MIGAGWLGNIGCLLRVPPGGGQEHVDPTESAALAWDEAGRITYAGPEAELPQGLQTGRNHDAGGRLVIPGLIDCHTHLCFAGWRGDEFRARLAGKSYQQIAAAGGGIMRTVQATRQADPEALYARALDHLVQMSQLGVTTVEAKSGYGLNVEDELKQLRVYERLNREQPVELVPTFLGAHLVPPEFAGKRKSYVDLLCKELIPRVAREGLARFCDAYVEKNAFTLKEGRRILEVARSCGLGLKLHADQLSAGGGAALAAELGAVSAEHLEYADADGIRRLADAGTVAVSLPLASLYLRERYLDAPAFISEGVPVAVATDFNPGSAPSFHIHLALLLACTGQGMTPAGALKGATAYAARALAMENRTGSLLEGYAADAAVIDAPEVDHWLYHFRPNACVGTLKRGAWIHREF